MELARMYPSFFQFELGSFGILRHVYSVTYIKQLRRWSNWSYNITMPFLEFLNTLPSKPEFYSNWASVATVIWRMSHIIWILVKITHIDFWITPQQAYELIPVIWPSQSQNQQTTQAFAPSYFDRHWQLGQTVWYNHLVWFGYLLAAKIK